MIAENRVKEILTSYQNNDPILVIGDLGVDKYTYGDVKRISPEAPVPIIEVTREWNKLGLAANVSDNLLSMGVKSTICGVVGEDTNADELESLLENAGLSTWGVIRDQNRKTTFKERIVTKSQQICRVDYETKDAMNQEIASRVETRVQEFVANHSAVIIEDYGKGLLSEELIQNTRDIFQAREKIVCVDPSRWTPASFYKGVDLLKPNLAEAIYLVQGLGYQNETDLGTIAEILTDKLSIGSVAITLGPEGMAIYTPDYKEVKIIPTYTREVFDVSGAGDTAIASICTSLVTGATLEEAAWIGNLAGGVVVSKKGTATVTRDEINQQYYRMKESLG
jgi:rfaE bifunctional protein kinase chain/domain